MRVVIASNQAASSPEKQMSWLRKCIFLGSLFASVKAFLLNSRRSLSSLHVSTNGKSILPTPTTETDSTDFPHAFVAERTRADFPILTNNEVIGDDKELIYLDSAATSQKPIAVIQALDEYYSKTNANVHRGAHTLSRAATTAYEAARDKVQAFIGATSRNEIVFTSGATDAINLVVQTFGRSTLRAGDRVVLTVCEHHANLVPWQILAEELDLDLQYAKLSSDESLDMKHFRSLIHDRTKIVAFQHVSNVLSIAHPVDQMVSAVRKQAHTDCKILLDACQSVPHMPVNVQELGVDFVVASGHKMCGPTGIGFLWAPEDLLNSMPPWRGGGEMIDQVTLTGSTWQPAPGRFEAGTPAIAQAVGLGAAIDYLNAVGMENIHAYEVELGNYLYKRMTEIPSIRILGPSTNRAGIVAFAHASIHPSDMSTFLDIEGVAIRAGHHCCQPLHDQVGLSHSARASIYFYNTREDIDKFIDHLKTTIRFFETEEGKGGSECDDFVPFI